MRKDLDVDPLQIRGQFDAACHQRRVSALYGRDFSVLVDGMVGTRQEFGPDVDVNNILTRSGVPAGPPLQFGEYDFELTLQQGLAAQRAAGDAWSRLPAEVRRRYGSWPKVLRAMASGELKFGDVLDEGPPKGPPVGEKPPEAPKEKGA